MCFPQTDGLSRSLEVIQDMFLLFLAIKFGVLTFDNVFNLVKANGNFVAFPTRSCVFMCTLFF